MPAARQADVPVGLRRAEFATLTIRSTEGIFVSKSKTTNVPYEYMDFLIVDFNPK